MDKLRAIEYMVRTVEDGSFTSAAKSLEVSTPAVAQLVRALERSLGIVIFHRTSKGLSLTADGERYYDVTRRITADLRELEQNLSPQGARLRGTLTVGMRDAVALNCLMPHIGRFLNRYPEVELINKPARTPQDITEGKLDVAVLIGWPAELDLMVRPLAQTRYVVCASPGYWNQAGWPREPKDLASHHCLLFRSSAEILLDRWIFEKNGDRQTVDVKSRLISEDRPWMDEAARSGAGVIRLADLTVGRSLASGQLIPVLAEWDSLEAPTIYAVYPRNQRSSKLVRAFLDFTVEVFAELESKRSPASMVPRVPKPNWFGRTHGRQSAYVSRPTKQG